MQIDRKTLLLFFIILAEGYVVLACELLAIRQLIPFVGSGTETVSIVISAVLLPLAIGYHYGGSAYHDHWQRAKERSRKKLSVRKLLLKNILSGLVILTLGLSYPFLEFFFGTLRALGFSHRLVQTPIYCALFLVFPVFLLGQTVPLVSNYFSRSRLSEITGRMLFFSTAGSFLGSVFSTIVLMTFIGVHSTVIVTLGILCVLAMLLVRTFVCYETVFCAMLFAFLFMLNSPANMRDLNIVSNNAYNLVQIVPDETEHSTIMAVNRSGSSKISESRKNDFPYMQFIREHFIDPIAVKGSKPRDILVIGAGGFTAGLYDEVNNYTYVDIDRSLKDVAERSFLHKKLPPQQQFVAASARAFVRTHDKQYDLIIIDVFTNTIAVPMECTTREFLQDVKKLIKPQGALVANVISSPTFADKFSVRYTRTFGSVFSSYSRQIIGDFSPWPKSHHPKEDFNVLYIYFNNPLVDDNGVYTDDKNTYSLDRK